MFLHAVLSVERHVSSTPTVSSCSLNVSALRTHPFFEPLRWSKLIVRARALMRVRQYLRIENSGCLLDELGNKPVFCIP